MTIGIVWWWFAVGLTMFLLSLLAMLWQVMMNLVLM